MLKIKTFTMLGCAGPSPCGVSPVDPGSQTRIYIRGASQPACLRTELRYRQHWRRWQKMFAPLPSQHAKLLLTWMPDVRPDVQADLPGTMYSSRGRVTAEWAQEHQLVDDACIIKVRKESIA